MGLAKDTFITQDRNEDFKAGQVEATFSRGHCDPSHQWHNFKNIGGK